MKLPQENIGETLQDIVQAGVWGKEPQKHRQQKLT
jgi:hypothetical protein